MSLVKVMKKGSSILEVLKFQIVDCKDPLGRVYTFAGPRCGVSTIFSITNGRVIWYVSNSAFSIRYTTDDARPHAYLEASSYAFCVDLHSFPWFRKIPNATRIIGICSKGSWV